MLAEKKRDPFLANPNKIHTEILCVRCREPLWRQRVLKRSGNRVLSTETLPAQDGVPPFSPRHENCPFCGEKFFARAKSGGQMYLLKDLNCGITRLI